MPMTSINKVIKIKMSAGVLDVDIIYDGYGVRAQRYNDSGIKVVFAIYGSKEDDKRTAFIELF